MSQLYPELSKPFKIGNVEIKNKVVMSPMLPIGWFDEHSVISDKIIDYYEERAKGGVGAVFTTGNVPDAHLEDCPFTISPFGAPEHFSAQISKLADRLHKYDTKLFVQIWFGLGRVAFPDAMNTEPVAVSEGPDRWDPSVTCREMTTEEVYGLIDSVVEGAKLLYKAGADGVDINGGYGGYMGDQFTTSAFNHRTDEFGGSMDNQLRVLTEIVKRIKKETAEDFPVTVRFSTKHHIKAERQAAVDGEVYEEFGRDIDESIAMGKKLEEAGYDAFLLGNGSYDSFHWLYPPMYQKEGLWLDDFAPFTKEMNVPCIGPGKILQPQMANDAIKNGTLTAVALGRALLADPEWMNKAEAGKPEEIRPCIGCNAGCVGRIFAGKTMLCAVNANLFDEAHKELAPAAEPKKIAVIGAGVGGMEAARLAAARGHEVTIYDDRDRVGGMTLVADIPDYKAASRRLIAWYENELKKAGVKVVLNTRLSEEDVKNLDADTIIVATGATAKKLPVPGADQEHVISSVEALTKAKPIGENVVVVGGGQVGCEVAYELAKEGKKTSVVEFMPDLVSGGKEPISASVSLMLKDLLNFEKVDIYTSSALKEIKENTVCFEKSGEMKEIPADTVILAIGFNANDNLYQSLKDSGKDVRVIGDAKQSPGNVLHAVADGYALGREI